MRACTEGEFLMEVTAAVLREVGGDFGLEKVQLDAPRPGEVLVQISAVGICHTDLATRDGALPFPLPGVLGHEGAGVVVEVGEGVTKVAPGDSVGVSFASCGSCPACASGAPAYCPATAPRPSAPRKAPLAAAFSDSPHSPRTRSPGSGTSSRSAPISRCTWSLRSAAAYRPARAP